MSEEIDELERRLSDQQADINDLTDRLDSRTAERDGLQEIIGDAFDEVDNLVEDASALLRALTNIRDKLKDA